MFANARLALTSIEKDDSVHMAIYDDKLRNEILWNQEITAQLADAIKNRDLRPYLQPIADSDGNIVGCEALVRWIHPELGFINPGVFIPLFEENGLIEKLDQYVWNETARQIRQWQDEQAIERTKRLRPGLLDD